MNVGVAGVGEMGAAMAARLLDTDHQTFLWNRTSTAGANLVARGARRVGDIPELFAAAAVVVSMLADDRAAEAVFAPDVLERLPADALHVSCSTLSIGACRRLAEQHRAAGVAFVAAPVLGRSPVAAQGKLNIVAAGEPEAVDRARPVLDVLGKRTWVLGQDPAMATLVKIGVNYNLLHALQALAESIALVERGGIDPTEFVDILTDAAFTGSAYGGYGPMIAERRYSPPGFTLDLGLKDLGLAEAAATDLDVSLPVAAVLRDVFETALARTDLDGLDWSAMAEVTRGVRAR